MRILIIGACGYIGSAVEARLGQDHDIGLNDWRPGGLLGDGIDYRVLPKSALAWFDTIVWLAGHSSVAMARSDPMGAVGNNCIGLTELVAKLDGQPLLWASSASVLSPVGNNVYDATKLAAEALIPALYPNSCALRFGTVCGASPNMRWDLMINRMWRDATTDGIVRVSNPDVRRPILWIGDLCDALGGLVESWTKHRDVVLASFNTTPLIAAKQIADRYSVPIERLPDSPSYDFAVPSPVRSPAAATLSDILDDLDARRGAAA